jgi:hypothetical protein
MFAENLEDVFTPKTLELYQNYLNGNICCIKDVKKSWCVQNKIIFFTKKERKVLDLTKELSLSTFFEATSLEEVDYKWDDKLRNYSDNLQNNHLKLKGRSFTYFYFDLDNTYYYKNQDEPQYIGNCHPVMLIRDMDNFEYEQMTNYEINYFKEKILVNMLGNFNI